MTVDPEEHESVSVHSEGEHHGSLTGGRKSRRGGSRKSRRGGSRKSRRGGRKSRRGGRKSRRGGRKSRRGGRKSRRGGRKSRRGGRKSRRGGAYPKKKSCKGGRRKSCPKYCRRKTVRCQSYRRPKKVGRKHKKHRK